MLRTSTDAEIIADCAGDPDRFREIFERHYGPILAYARRRVGSQIAEDLAVETFAVAFRRLASYDLQQADARPWLFGIATNLLRHHLRTERRQLIAYARSGVDPASATDPGFDAAEERAQAGHAGAILALALAHLRAQERDVQLLYAWADLTYREIADALRIPVGTVRSRLSRARRRMRELLDANGQVLGEGDEDERSGDE